MCVGGEGSLLGAMNCVYVCLILQYSQDHTILSPFFDAGKKGVGGRELEDSVGLTLSIKFLNSDSLLSNPS